MVLFEIASSPFIYRLALAVLTGIVLLTLASQFGQYFLLELTTHFRLQYVLAATFCAVFFIVFQSWKFLPIAIVCAVLNAIYLTPYIGSASYDDSASGTPLRLLHANVLKKNTNYKAIFDLVSRTAADVVVLQEVTENWNKEIEVLQSSYPFTRRVPGLEGAGMAVLSRFPFEQEQVLNLDASTHVAILAQIRIAGTPITLLSLHPPTPITPGKFANRNRQLEEAAKLLNSIDVPKILVGDLNTTMWSPYFTALTGRTGLRDVRLGFGLKTSWPMPLPSVLRLPIDHCLVSSDLKVKDVQIGVPVDSDHRPLIVDLVVGTLQRHCFSSIQISTAISSA